MCPCPNTIHRASASLNPDKIVTKAVQLLLNSGLPGFADCHNTDNRRNPNGYSQDRQDAAHLVPEQRHYVGLK
jgi:hypothetical protein